MRVLLFTSSYAPRTGGLETVTSKLAQNLVSRGYSVTVLTNRYPHALPPFEIIDGIHVYRQLYPDLLPGEPGSAVAALRRAVMLALVPFTLLRLAILLRHIRPDVVNIHYFSSPAIYALLVAQAVRIPTVLSFHGSDVTRVRPGRHRFALVRAIRMADICTTCSQDLADRLDQTVERPNRPRAVIAANGVDPDTSTIEYRDLPEAFMLVVARLVEAKGVDVAIKSAAILARQGLEIPLVIAGDGPERSALQRLAESFHLADLVRFYGALEGPAVRALIRQSWCVVVPSRSEGFGIVCLEAMMEARPVVASRVGGVPEIVRDGETGVLVPPDTPEELARAIASLYVDAPRIRRMGRRGQQRARECFSWERTADSYISAYTAATSQPEGAAWTA